MNRNNKNSTIKICKKSAAFTIVELLVVIVVIGILAAITIVSYSGISRQAIAVALQSDLNANAKLLELYNVDHEVYPDSLGDDYCPDAPVPDTRYCLKASDDNELTYTGGDQEYTLTDTNTPTGLTYEITNGGAPTEVAGHGGGGGSGIDTFSYLWGYEDGDDIAYSIANTSDGGYVVAGKAYPTGVSSDAYISKYAADGILEWTRTWGGTGLDVASGVVQTADGGYVITGGTNSSGFVTGSNDMFIVKYTSDGTLSWNKTWGGSLWDYGASVTQIDDGGIIVTGNERSSSTGSYDMFMVKYTNLGAISWTKTWGGTAADHGTSVTKTADGGFAIVGKTASYTSGYTDLFITKYNANGVLSWNKVWGSAEGNEEGRGITEAADGSLVVVGTIDGLGSNFQDAFVVKLESDGDLSWNRIFGGDDNDAAYSVAETTDGGFAIAGQTDKLSENNGIGSMTLVKFTSGGDLAWSKAFDPTNAGFGVISMSDGGIIGVGYEGSYSMSGTSNSFIVKTTADGNVSGCSSPNCQSITPNVINPIALTLNPTAASLAPSLTVKTPAATTGDASATFTYNLFE